MEEVKRVVAQQIKDEQIDKILIETTDGKFIEFTRNDFETTRWNDVLNL